MISINYDILHKLRGPLATTKWTLDLFKQDDDLTKKQKDRVDDLYSANEKLIRITNELAEACCPKEADRRFRKVNKQ